MQTQAFNIILPKDLVQWADRMAQAEYKNRSELIREALLRYLEEADDWKKIFAWGEKTAKKMGIKSEADVNKIVYEFRHGRS